MMVSLPLAQNLRVLSTGNLVLGDLNRAGFVLNVPKCCLEPSQGGKWLGFIIDLVEGKFQVPEEKLTKL